MVILPKNYNEALDALEDSQLRIIAGGTDVMVRNRSWAGLAPAIESDVLNVFHLKELDYIKEDEEGLHIGSLTKLESLLNSPLVSLPLKEAIKNMASPAIRHVATLSGNIGNASPAGDTLPVLYVYDAIVVLESIKGIRKVSISDFITGPGKTTRQDNELIKEVILKDLDYTGFYYEKVGGRRSDAISKLSFVGLYTRDKQGALVDVRIGFGAVYKTVLRDLELEKLLIQVIQEDENEDTQGDKKLKNKSHNKGSLEDLVDKYEKLIKPIDDQRSSAYYRKQCALNLLKSFIQMIGGK